MKAKNISKGDWIKVGGKPVQVTNVEDGGFWGADEKWVDGVDISYRGGSKRGMLRRKPGEQVTHLAGKRGWW
jgi:hypothetical protein